MDFPNCRTSEPCDQVLAALFRALPKIEAASKDALNPHLKNRYADLTSVMDAVRAPLFSEKLAVMQPASIVDKRDVRIATVVLHESGQWIANEITLVAADEKPQSIGSTITYARRYSISGMLGVTTDDDDDGNAGSGRNGGNGQGKQQDAPRQQQRPQTTPKPAAVPPNEQMPDTGGNPVGTQAAANHVRDTKLAALQAEEAERKAAKPWSTFKEMLARYNEQKVRFGAQHETLYYKILGSFGWKHANEIRDPQKAVDCFAQLVTNADLIARAALEQVPA